MSSRTKSTAVPMGTGEPRPIGVIGLSGFCVAATVIACTSAVSLLWPGGPLEPMWRLNPTVRVGFARMGPWAIVLLGTVGVASAFSAAGLWSGKQWGRRLVMVGLALNALGDLTNAIVSHDPRTLVGVPVAALIIAYLASRRVRRYFAGSG
jgi:hypothetical protein